MDDNKMDFEDMGLYAILINRIFNKNESNFFINDIKMVGNDVTSEFMGTCLVSKKEYIKVTLLHGTFEEYLKSTPFYFEFSVGISEALNDYIEHASFDDDGTFKEDAYEHYENINIMINDIDYIKDNTNFVIKLQDLSEHNLNYISLYIYANFYARA